MSNLTRWMIGVFAGFFGFAGSLAAQPAEFIDLGETAAAASPPSAQEFAAYDEGIDPFANPPQVLTVLWYKITLTAPIQGDLFIDVFAPNGGIETNVLLAIYDNRGNLVGFDEGPGGAATSPGSGLSYGSTRERVPYGNAFNAGQNGATLAAGTYWIAIIAGDTGDITLNPTGWGVSTTQSYELGLDPGQAYLGFTIIVGNTTFPQAPTNDNCENAIVVSEDVGDSPAWSGTTLGATQDGFSPCYPDLERLTTKDIWFTYIPSRSGWINAVLGGGAGGAAKPILTRYDGGCGSSPVRCSGGGSFASPVGTRLVFQVEAGQPVLFGATIRAGQWGPLTLNLDLLDPPCDVQAPAFALQEADQFCGDTQNDGCEAGFGTYDVVQYGETVEGTLWNSLFEKDFDYYRLSLPTASTVEVTARSQLPFFLAILSYNASTNCPGRVRASVQSYFYPDACDPVTITAANLAAGEYVVLITHNAFDDFTCDSGYGAYTFSVNDPSCPRATFTDQPDAAESCENESAVFTVAASGPSPITYAWQWGVESGGSIAWSALTDGPFVAAGSAAVISGAATPTLTIASLDTLAAVRFRAVASRPCGSAFSRPAALSVNPAGTCVPACPADFNNDGFLDFFDYADFVACFEGDACPNSDPLAADYNDDGFVDFFDYGDFVLDFEAGC
jgi:hypothetical protein